MNPCESQSPARPAPSDPASTIRVALVEDDTSVRRILRNWIQHAGSFTCVSDSADAEAAIKVLPEQHPDVALVDINLPRLNGIECVRALKPQIPKTQFVMLTVYEDADHIFDALAAGATGYLVKRTPREALIKALTDVHAGGSPMSANIARKVVQSFQRAQPVLRTSDRLSARENQVLELLAQGYLYKEIADLIGISLPTVSTYIRRIYEKLHVHSRAQAVARYTRP